MRYTFALLAAAIAIQASPVPFAFPQAVTAKISPKASAPPGCTHKYTPTFGLAVQNITKTISAQKVISTISDGQPQNPTGSQAVSAITTIGDGQPQAPTGTAISTIGDGQPQAPTGTAISTIGDGQPQAPTGTAISTIGDGQPQAPTGTAISTIGDGQPQAPTGTAISTIGDGQPQAPTGTAISTIGDGQPQAPTGTAISTIGDGQPQAPTGTAISTIGDGQPQAPTGTAITTIGDGQPQAPTGTGTAITTISDGQPQAPTKSANKLAAATSVVPAPQMVACKTNSSLQITLSGGVLMDEFGRTGYIASNYQFQFDKPPQAGAIYTAGWSLCGNGSLALGGSNVFYQCLSGNFFNLYNEDWAAQCSPITLNAVELIKC